MHICTSYYDLPCVCTYVSKFVVPLVLHALHLGRQTFEVTSYRCETSLHVTMMSSITSQFQEAIDTLTGSTKYQALVHIYVTMLWILKCDNYLRTTRLSRPEMDSFASKPNNVSFYMAVSAYTR